MVEVAAIQNREKVACWNGKANTFKVLFSIFEIAYLFDVIVLPDLIDFLWCFLPLFATFAFTQLR